MLVAWAGMCAPASAQFALRDGDRVAFYGDSITDNTEYTAYLETYVLTRYPKLNIRFFNAGVGGDTVRGGALGPIDDRLTNDLFSRKPTVVTVLLGMNDAGYREFEPTLFETFKTGYRHILDRFRTDIPTARVWLLRPTPYDDVTRTPTIPGGYNSVLLKYGEAVAGLAKEYGHWSLDLNYPLADALYRAYSLDAAGSTSLIPDRIHPNFGGHLVMAAALLKEWGASRTVSEVGIDAGSGSLVEKGGRVSNLKRGDTIEWDQEEDVLPFPIDRREPTTVLAEKSAPVVDEMLTGEILRVTGLRGKTYQLRIDEQPIGKFSADQLAAGVDLAKFATPMAQQAAEVNVLVHRRKDLKWSMWRNVEWSLRAFDSKERTEAIRAVEKLEEDLIRRQKAMAKPRPHHFVLAPVTSE